MVSRLKWMFVGLPCLSEGMNRMWVGGWAAGCTEMRTFIFNDPDLLTQEEPATI